jgi:hypothetical protein
MKPEGRLTITETGIINGETVSKMIKITDKKKVCEMV